LEDAIAVEITTNSCFYINDIFLSRKAGHSDMSISIIISYPEGQAELCCSKTLKME